MKTDQDHRLLYFSPSWSGGLADYAHEQCQALGRLEVKVTLLTAPGYVVKDSRSYETRRTLRPIWPASLRLYRKLIYIFVVLQNHFHLAKVIRQGHFRYVLAGSFAEYLSPLWVRPLRRLAHDGVVFGAVVHDPVRDYEVGPRWWHRWSVAAAYSYLREVFVHEAIELDTVRPVPELQASIVPHGPYRFPHAKRTPAQVRADLKIPSNAKILLSFGHVRDGKNLDLVIRAVASEPQVYLVIAGKVSSNTQKPIEHYQAIAHEVGVAARCCWLTNYIPANQVGDLFEACDAVLLTYSSSFRSASGVLNAAVSFRRPCIASSGMGNLRSMVLRYGLGVFVEPDKCEAIRNGIRRLLEGIPEPSWAKYACDNTWDKNARIVRNRMWSPSA
jgi:glycosyltransferase involved in cell wall biosynthesis